MTVSFSTRRSGLFARAVAVAAALLTVAACGDGGSGGDSAAEPTSSAIQPIQVTLPEKIKSAGVLRVGTSFNFPPLNFKNDKNEYDGIEPALMDALGQKLGLRIERVETNFAGLLPGLQADRFDIVASGMNDTTERQAEVDFVDYLESGTSVLVKKDNPKGIDGPDDLCGAVLGETVGTVYIGQLEKLSADCTAAGKPAIDIQTLPSGSEVAQAIVTGRVDATFANHVANLYFADQTGGQLAVVGDRVSAVPLGIALPKGDKVLADAIRAGLTSMIEDGSYGRILDEWGITDAALTTITVNGKAA
ncbi:ABC transporter substrate-binding protein [Phytohabitans sp. ZYX-F-186]|uniref:ABC transporter substrate-binding protein n=1 Tax=Phytohabitans maris TaxID=3071409 RepID=A0ABU0ZFN4_9ACTN|nr:ABC transporter substrate-binding protein [Phytohabitans sp. ZYX-F-186]MDQ7905199.1 ABC transporter substrate-binding protein [Phytohabitans sp. ZYX-F-186]